MEGGADASEGAEGAQRRCCRDRKKSRRPVKEQMLVRMRDEKSGIWKKTQRNEGRVGGATR